MEKKNKYFFAFIISMFILGFLSGSLVLNWAYSRTAKRTGSKLDTAIELNREITDEQRRELERNQRAIATIENLGRKFKETDSTLGELRMVNRGSSDILQAIRAEINILENFFWDTGDELYNYHNHDGSELNSE